MENEMPLLLWVVFPFAILSACFAPIVGLEEGRPDG
jgi:hypothetical protein